MAERGGPQIEVAAVAGGDPYRFSVPRATASSSFLRFTDGVHSVEGEYPAQNTPAHRTEQMDPRSSFL